MRDAWLYACALLSLLMWTAFGLVRLTARSPLCVSAILAGLVVGRIAVERGW